MASNRRRLLFWTPVVLALVAALAFTFRPQPILVEGAVVDRGPLAVTVAAEGRTRTREVYVVSAPLTGRLLRLDLDVGDAVTGRTTVVASIRPTAPSLLDLRTRRELQAELNAAEAALALAAAERARAEAELGFATSELDRAQRLVQRGTISAATLERAELDVKTARARLASADADRAVKLYAVETVRARLSEPGVGDESGDEGCCVEVLAPVDGVVLRLLRESESVVAAGEPLVELGDPRDLEVVADVLSRDAVRLRPEAEVVFDNWGGDATLTGRIERVEPFAFTEISALGIEEQRVNVIIRLDDPPDAWAPLGHGYRLDARLVVWASDDVLRAPVTALYRNPEGAPHVFVVQDGRAVATAVTVGRTNASYAQVVAGLGADDVVIRFPSARISDGARVRLRAF